MAKSVQSEKGSGMEEKDKKPQEVIVDAEEEMKNKVNAPFLPGEKGFPLFFLVIGLFFMYQSWQLVVKAAATKATYGDLPMFVSTVITLLSIVLLIQDRNAPSESAGLSFREKFLAMIRFLFPKEVTVVIILILGYCMMLNFGLGFYIATPIFLWVSICFLMKKDYIKNILWTAVCILFIYVVFSTIFAVVLP